MQKMTHFLLSGCLMLFAGLAFANAPQEATPPSQDATPPAEPAKPPRVVGQPQSQAEWDAWQIIDQAATPGEKAELSRRFLETFPESGLTANAHYLIAQNFYQLGDLASFVPHAEEALAELPESVDLLSQLGFYYAEKGQASKAIERASKALEVFDRISKPERASNAEWVNQSFQLKAEANYALGRAYLTRITKTGDRSKDPNLAKSIEFLQKALEFDPRHDYACFRLGFAFRNANNADGAVKAYAQAIAIGQVAAGPAQGQLEQVLEIIKKAVPDSQYASKNAQEIVTEAAAELQAAVTKNQEARSQQIQDLDQLQLAPVSPAPAIQ